ncbi:MAG: hypothetical protein HKN42_06950 [Granulosicoccus sp.]|nr:hypothetical protein [Granulosicoccus sp.]
MNQTMNEILSQTISQRLNQLLNDMLPHRLQRKFHRMSNRTAAKSGRFSRGLIAAVLVFAATGALAHESSEHLVKVPVPVNSVVQSIGENVKHEGVAVSMATFDSPLPLEQTIKFYRQLWTERGSVTVPGIIETRTRDWLILSRLQDGHNAVLQLRVDEPGRSHGFVSVMHVPADSAARQIESGIPGLERLSTTESHDASRQSVLSVYASDRSIDSLASELVRYWRSHQWTLVSEESHLQSKVLLLNRQSRTLDVVIANDRQKTLVIVNEVSGRA